jgi:hypothetical protein
MSKYQEFQEKRKSLEREVIEASDFYYLKSIAEDYNDLLGKVLEAFKSLEENLEWRRNVEAIEWRDDDSDHFESDEERDLWNNLMRLNIEKQRKKRD